MLIYYSVLYFFSCKKKQQQKKIDYLSRCHWAGAECVGSALCVIVSRFHQLQFAMIRALSFRLIRSV